MLGSVSNCVVILRTPHYWSVRVASCNLNLAGNSFHCRSRTACDMTYKRDTTFVDESKDFYVKKSGQSSCRRAERSWLVGVRRRKRPRLDKNCLLRSPLHQYTCMYKQPTPYCINDNCLFRRHPRTHASCDTVVWIQPWTRNEKIGSKWVQTRLFGRQTFKF